MWSLKKILFRPDWLPLGLRECQGRGNPCVKGTGVLMAQALFGPKETQLKQHTNF